MGCVYGKTHGKTNAGERVLPSMVPWNGLDNTDYGGIEVEGMHLLYYLQNFSGIGLEEQQQVGRRLAAIVDEQSFCSAAGGFSPCSTKRLSASTSEPSIDSINEDEPPIGFFNESSPFSFVSRSPRRFRSTDSAAIVDALKNTASGHPAYLAHQDVVKLRNVKVGVVSWNVGGISDHRKEVGCGVAKELRDDASTVMLEALRQMGQADVIVIGLQEVISLTPANAMRTTLDSMSEQRRRGSFALPSTFLEWAELLQFCIKLWSAELMGNLRYMLFGQPVYLFGMLMCVFCAKERLRNIKDFGHIERPLDNHHTGAKGVIACRFVLCDRSFCFMSCHLSAQKGNTWKHSLRSYEKRVQEIKRCWNEVKFRSHVDQMIYPASAHRVVFMLGDLNMRLSDPLKFRRRGMDFHNVVQNSLTEDTGLRMLWELDQLAKSAKTLRSSMMGRESSGGQELRGILKNIVFGAGGEGLHDWTEAICGKVPPFRPTFKLAVPGPGYSTKRIPAWTDRVLFRSRHAVPRAYGSIVQEELLSPSRNLSDHDPVYANFDVSCVAINMRGLQKIIDEVVGDFKSDVQSATSSKTAAFVEARDVIVDEQGSEFRGIVMNANLASMMQFSTRLFEDLRIHYGDDPEEFRRVAAVVLEAQEKLWSSLSAEANAELATIIARVRSEVPRGAPEAEAKASGSGDHFPAAGSAKVLSETATFASMATAPKSPTSAERPGSPIQSPQNFRSLRLPMQRQMSSVSNASRPSRHCLGPLTESQRRMQEYLKDYIACLANNPVDI